jgi:hypothetical protein
MVQVRWQNRTGMRTSSSAVLGWGSGPELLLDGVSGERQGERRSVRRSFTGSAQLVCVDDSGPRIVPVTVDDVSTDAVGLALGESDLSPVATAIILRFDHESPIVALVSPMRTQPGRSVLHIDRIASRDRARLATYVVGPRRGDTRRQAPAA